MPIRSATHLWILTGSFCLLGPCTAHAKRALIKNLATGIHDYTEAQLPARVHDVDWRWNGPTTTLYPFVVDSDALPVTFLALVSVHAPLPICFPAGNSHSFANTGPRLDLDLRAIER